MPPGPLPGRIHAVVATVVRGRAGRLPAAEQPRLRPPGEPRTDAGRSPDVVSGRVVIPPSPQCDGRQPTRAVATFCAVVRREWSVRAMRRRRLSVVGTGYLGATHATCMAELGHDVVGVDVDAGKVAALSSGEVPF